MARYIDLEMLERRIKKYVKPEIPEEKAYIPKPYGAAKVVDEYAVDDLVKEMIGGNNDG